MSNLSKPLPPLRDVIASHGLWARKSLGQNFLLDVNLTRRIVKAAGSLKGRTVIEIGPGPGGLTRALLESDASHIIAIDRDKRFIQALESLSNLYPNRLTLLSENALQTDLSHLISGPTKIVANLPFNIGTTLLLNWICIFHKLESLTLMFQKEVAQRLISKPGTKSYGRLSIIVQWKAHITRHFDVPPSAFVPAPRVFSTVVGIRPRKQHLALASQKYLEALTAAAFGQRRKMLRSSLRGLGINVIELLKNAKISEQARPEDLDVETFCRMARTLEKMLNTRL